MLTAADGEDVAGETRHAPDGHDRHRVTAHLDLRQQQVHVHLALTTYIHNMYICKTASILYDDHDVTHMLRQRVVDPVSLEHRQRDAVHVVTQQRMRVHVNHRVSRLLDDVTVIV